MMAAADRGPFRFLIPSSSILLELDGLQHPDGPSIDGRSQALLTDTDGHQGPLRSIIAAASGLVRGLPTAQVHCSIVFSIFTVLVSIRNSSHDTVGLLDYLRDVANAVVISAVSFCGGSDRTKTSTTRLRYLTLDAA